MEKLNASAAGKRLVGIVMYVFNQTKMKKEKKSLKNKKVMLFPHLILGKLNAILPHYNRRVVSCSHSQQWIGQKIW